jgi:hypothetical protein
VILQRFGDEALASESTEAVMEMQIPGLGQWELK